MIYISVGQEALSQVKSPATSSPISPVFATEPGQTLNTLTPTLHWTKVSGITHYEVGVSLKPYGEANVVWGVYTTATAITPKL